MLEKHLVNEGFIKSTDHRPTDHRPTDHRPLTHRPTDYGCSFAAKLSWKKKFFFSKKIFVFLQNIHYLQQKMFLYGKKVL